MTIDDAIATVSDSDPIIKLLLQVKQGRMRPDDAGLRAITESWLETYNRVLSAVKDAAAIRRLDPAPRLAVLEECGVIPSSHPSASSLRDTFQRAISSNQ